MIAESLSSLSGLHALPLCLRGPGPRHAPQDLTTPPSCLSGSALPRRVLEAQRPWQALLGTILEQAARDRTGLGSRGHCGSCDLQDRAVTHPGTCSSQPALANGCWPQQAGRWAAVPCRVQPSLALESSPLPLQGAAPGPLGSFSSCPQPTRVRVCPPTPTHERPGILS